MDNIIVSIDTPKEWVKTGKNYVNMFVINIKTIFQQKNLISGAFDYEKNFKSSRCACDGRTFCISYNCNICKISVTQIWT